MARDFDGSADKLDTGLDLGSISATTNLTWACWIQMASATAANGAIASVKANQTFNPIIQWRINDGNDGFMDCFIRDSADVNFSLDESETDIRDAAWHHVALVRETVTANKWYMYVDGVQEPSGGTTDTTGQINLDGRTLYIAARNNQGTEDQNLDAEMAEFSTWTRALTATEIGILAKGYSAIFIPNGIQFYTPIIGRDSPEKDLIGGLSVTVDGTTNFAHPRIIYPTPQQMIRFGSTAAVAAGNVDWPGFMNRGFMNPRF